MSNPNLDTLPLFDLDKLCPPQALSPSEILANLQGGRSDSNTGNVPTIPDYRQTISSPCPELEKLSEVELESLTVPVMERICVRRASIGEVAESLGISQSAVVDVMRTKRWRELLRKWKSVEAQVLLVHPIARRFERLGRLEDLYLRTEVLEPKTALACLSAAKAEMALVEGLEDGDGDTDVGRKRAISGPTFTVNVLPYPQTEQRTPVHVQVSETTQPRDAAGVQ